ncbi:MAG: enoyl-CoA hydratase-related protein [Balneolaceae bacterium]|nr:enoyl-CoA hydratase-related protein [Balneolaceae bacterium]
MDYLSIEEQESITVITLNQEGEKVNKLNETLIEEFDELLDRFEEDENIEGMVLISGKEDNFIAGADVEMLKK